MVTKNLIKALRANKRAYIRTMYKGFNIEIYEDYGSLNRSIYEFRQDSLQMGDFINICCPKALSYLLKTGDEISIKIYNNSYGEESSLFKAGFNYKMTFIRIVRKDKFVFETLVSTEVKVN